MGHSARYPLAFSSFCALVIVAIIATSAPAFAALPKLDVELTPDTWRVLGPFHTGPRESGTDPLWYQNEYQIKFPPDFTATYPSIFARTGHAGWSEFKTGEAGLLEFTLENPPAKDWADWTDEYGRGGASWRGVAYAYVTAPIECTAIVDAQRVGGFKINGRAYSGDPYGHGVWLQPVKLDKGDNHILVGVSDYEGSASFSFRIVPPPYKPAGIIKQDLLFPDIREYQLLDSWIGIPIVNYTDEWLRGLTIDWGYPEGLWSPSCEVPPIPPFGMVKVPMRIKTEDEVLGISTDEKELDAWVRVSAEGWDDRVAFKFRVRNARESWRETFISGIDGSVQKYAVKPPVPFEYGRKYALIITAHGASVDCDGLVDAYGPKDWAYVVAPTNRRPFGFDWQDWGRLDFLEVLDHAMQKLDIDENRVILTGHSMGGHGAWHIGVTHSDLFAAVCPIASWASHELYVPFTLRQSELFGPPEVRHILDRCVASDHTELLISNLSGVPVLAVHGDEDRVVAPTQPRLLIGELQKSGSDARLIEVPGADHWWDYDTTREGSDAVDTKELIDWTQDKTRNTDPDWVSFVTYDLANENSKNFIEILAQDKLYERTSVGASIAYGAFMEPGATEKPPTEPYAVVVSTQNVTALRFKPTEKLLGLNFRAQIDGDFIPFICSQEGHTFYRGADGHWTDKPPTDGIGRKFTGVTGPIKRAYYTPFIVVDMSNGAEPKCAELAANIAIRWWYRANGYCQVKNWSELTDADKRDYNLIIIATEKSLDPALAEYLPFKFVKEEEREMTTELIVEAIERNAPMMVMTLPGIEFDNRYFFGRDLSVQFVYPSPYNENKLIHVNMAQTEAAIETCAALTPLYSGSSLPDFVLGRRVDIARWGMAGAMALGFFDKNWRFDDSLMYVGQGAERVKE